METLLGNFVLKNSYFSIYIWWKEHFDSNFPEKDVKKDCVF